MLHMNGHERARSRTPAIQTLRALNVHPLRTAVSEVNSLSVRNVEYHDAIHSGRVAVVTGEFFYFSPVIQDIGEKLILILYR